MRVHVLSAIVLAAALLNCGGAAEQEEEEGAGSDALSAANVNGGSTGAMVRETTPAGFRGIKATWTLPDADPTKKGEPWVYYGIGDESRLDAEAGMAFQRGDGTAAKPHRWLPYVRRGSKFTFGKETTRALPGQTFTLEARLEGGAIHLLKDGVEVAKTALPLDASDAHVRRVVGQAVSTAYHGETLGALGPVVFAGTRVTRADGDEERFHDVAGWSIKQNGVVYGSVRFPANGTSHVYDFDDDVDRIGLFTK